MIDLENDYLYINGHPIISFDKEGKNPSILRASSMRGDGLLRLKKDDKNFIYIVDPSAPQFYINASKTVTVQSNEFPNKQQEMAENYSGRYFVLEREPGNI